MSNAMSMKVSQMEGRVPVTVIHVTGDIDANTHRALDEKAAALIGGGASNVLLDLSEVGYMSSAGFRSMHRMYTQTKEKGGSLRLLNPSAEIKRLMKAMGFDTQLPVHSELRGAIDAF